MDITKSENKITASKLFNGETVNYALGFFAASFIFIIIKQFCKIAFGISAQVSVAISFAVAAVILFFYEKKYVFNHNSHSKAKYQLILTLIRCGVDIGFFKLCQFIFGSVLHTKAALYYSICAVLLLFFNYYFDRLLVFDCRSNPLNNYRGRVFKLYYNNRYVLFSMLLALLCICFVYIVYTVFPFGENTVLRMDLYHQYGPMYCELYDRVVNHQSFLYSWVSGGGTSFLGNYFNYLASPFSFIILLFERKEMPFAITTMVLVKALLSAATFTYYLKASQKSHTFASASFGVLYAFSGYFLAYYWNIMWLDGMFLFPLIMLGIEKIIKDKKPVLYISTLTLLLYSSYYIGFMVCIFAIIYFLAYYAMTANPAPAASAAPLPAAPQDTNEKKKKITFSIKPITNFISGNRFLRTGAVFAYSSVLCGLLCAVSLIPVYMILQNSSATSDTMPSAMESYFDIINLITSHLAGLTTTIRSSGDDVLPNIYCGILPVLLLPLYIMNKDIRIKEKVVNVLLIIFFVFSFDNNIANYIWHANHFPNDLPYRFSFMYSFIILVIAYKALRHIKALQHRDIAVSGFLWVFLALFYQKFPTEKINEYTIYVTLGAVMIWTAVLFLIKKGHLSKLILGVTVAAIVFCEVITADTASYVMMREMSEYMAKYDTYQETINHVEKTDKSFYRQELCELDTRMDPCLYGYNGISVFSSMAYEKYSGLQYSLGMFGNRINSYSYNTQTPVYNMMYSMKYLTKTDDQISPSDDFYSSFYAAKDGKTEVFRNEYFLPIAFETPNDLKDWDTAEGDPFDVQEDFIDKAAGVSGAFIPCEYISSNTMGCTCEDITENGMYSFSKDGDNDSGIINVTIEAATDSNLYVYISSSEIDNVNYFWNDEEDTTDQYIDEPYIMDLGKHKKGDEIRIELSLAGMETDSSSVEIYAYSINKDVFTSAYDMLKAGALDITSYSDTCIEGTVNAGYDGYLYTSIPYDEGWSVYIDGEKVKTFELGECMLATTVKHGKHTVKYKYMPKGFNYGLIITSATWLCIIVYGVYRVLVEKGKKRREQNNNTVDF
ncbi:MAG: YfhO family protein [Eubacterium sp.]|nr:YfhO family protein [Eubacterium sp.]